MPFSSPYQEALKAGKKQKRKKSGNYYVYVESKRSNIALNHIWINGIPYNGDLKEVLKPEVAKEAHPNSTDRRSVTPDEMVPATKNKLFTVVFTALQPGQPVVPPKYSSKPLVMELQYKAKKKYFTLNEIKVVTAEAMY